MTLEGAEVLLRAHAGRWRPDRRDQATGPYPLARTTRNSMVPLSCTAMRPAMFGASMS